jgi:outer membrane protein TolC
MASIEKNKSAHLLAKKEYYPDFNVSLQYGQRENGNGMDRADFASAMVQMKVPLWHKTKEDKKVLETAARTRQMQENYESVKNRLFFRIKKFAGELERDNEQALLFRDGIIPQATASLDSAVAGYQVNKVNFLTLLDNQITLLNYEIEYYRALSNHEIKLAEMEEAVGVPIAELVSRNNKGTVSTK